MGLPTRLSEVGIDDTHFERLAARVTPIGNFKVLTKEDVVAIYRLAL